MKKQKFIVVRHNKSERREEYYYVNEWGGEIGWELTRFDCDLLDTYSQAEDVINKLPYEKGIMYSIDKVYE